MKKSVYFLLPLLFLSLASVQGADRWSLKQCLQAAYQANHMLKAQDFQIRGARMELKASQAQRLPGLFLSSGYTRVGRLTTIEFSTKPGEPPRKFTFGTPNRMNLDLRLQMPLFTWWRIDHSIHLARLNLEIKNLEQEKQKTLLTAQVLQAYFGALLSKKILHLTEQNVQRTQKYFEITQKRFNAGQLPKLQLLRAQVQLKTEQSRLETMRAEYQKSLVLLARVTGSNNNIEPMGELTYEPLTLEESDLIQLARQNRVELKQLGRQRAVLQTQQNLAASATRPNLDLVSNFSVMNGFNPMDPEKFYTNYNIGLQLNWPLFDGFSARYQAQSVYYGAQALSEQQKEIEANISLQIRQALISLQQAAQKIASQKANIDLARQALELAQKQYNQGMISSLDLLDAQRALLQTEMSYWQAVFSHILSKIELAKAAGNFSIFQDQM